MTKDTTGGLKALSPLMVFITIYLVTSIVAQDFYIVPISVAFAIASIYGIIITKNISLDEKITIFSKGAGKPNIMMMVWIFILAGAFASSAKAMGAIDETVNLTLQLLPDNLLLGGLFIAACFISISIGTSVGTIVALTPIAAGIAAETNMELASMVAIVVGGAFFGDNLSFISDTTVIATRSQGCKLSDKFKVNSQIVFPAAAITLFIYIVVGTDINSPQQLPEVNWVKVLPYVVVLVCAAIGTNVMIVLSLGCILTGIIGIMLGEYNIFEWMKSMGNGITGMGELIIITMLASGLLEIIRYNGGIEYILKNLTRHIHSKRAAEMGIAFLVSIVNVCTANNTVAIITVGSIANDIAEKYGVDKRKSASILDTFSCFTQGILPYGAQMLMAAGLAGINPISIIPHLYYPFIMGISALLSIILRYPKKFS